MATDIIIDIYPSALINISNSTGRIHTEENLASLAKSYGKSHIISGTINCHSGSVEFVSVLAVVEGRVIKLNGTVSHGSSGNLYIVPHFDDNGHILAGYDAISITSERPTNGLEYINLGSISSNKLTLNSKVYSGLEGDAYITELVSKINSSDSRISTVTTRVTTLENKFNTLNAENRISSLEDQIDEIATVGGQPNVIEKVQVNGTDLPITDKTVNVDIANATAKRVKNNLTIGGKTYNGSSAVSISTSDLGVYNKTESDNRYVNTTEYASSSAFGIAKVDGSTITATNGVISAKPYSLPTAGLNSLGGVKTTSSVTSTSGLTACPIINGVPYYKMGVTEEGLPVDTNTTYTISKSGNTITLTGSDGSTTTVSDSNTTYNKATSSAYGLVKVGYTENGKNYPVELDSNGKMFVNVPWTDTDTNTTYSEATSSVYGLVKTGYTESGKNYAVKLSEGKMYVTVPWTDTTYSKASSDSYGLVKVGYTGAYTPVEIDNNGKLYVNIPEGATYSKASPSTLGLVKPAADRTTNINPTTGGTTSNRYYGVELDSDGTMFVNVPWINSDTTYGQATAGSLGLIKVSSVNTSAVTVNSESSTANRYYPIELNNDGKAIVNVPWTDTNTDTIYTHPSYTSRTSGLYKITVNSGGHVSAATAVTKADITGLGIPSNDDLEWGEF